MRTVLTIAACALAACFSLQAQAQAFPSKQVTIIVGYPGGSPPEIEARLLADFLSKGWGQPVVIEPRPGAATVIAHQALLNAPADGHTLIFSSASISAFKVLVKDLPFEPMRDFAPVSLLVSFASGLATNAKVPAKTMSEFLAYAKANPGKVNYASAGQNTILLIMEALKQSTGAPLTEIPYPGLPQYMTALLRNDVQLVQATTNRSLKGQVDAGDVRVLVIVGAKRSPLFPDVPTSVELKLDLPRNDWQPILANGKTPKNLLDTIAAQVMKYANDPEARRTAQDRGVELVGSTPEQLREQMETDSRLYAKVAASIGLKPQ
jgi:tripartite-type tricarboxylate transporter receptor subunit TctC